MFGLGPTELIVIFILGVLLLGPQRIPEFASSLGKAIRSFRRATRELRDQIDIEDEVRRPLEDLRAALRDEPAPYQPPQVPRLVQPPSEEIQSTSSSLEPAGEAPDLTAAKTIAPASSPVYATGASQPAGADAMASVPATPQPAGAHSK